MDDTDKMCVYEGYNKARDCRVETLVKDEVHRYLSTSEWINAAVVFDVVVDVLLVDVVVVDVDVVVVVVVVVVFVFVVDVMKFYSSKR
jgi:hypothetical protein